MLYLETGCLGVAERDGGVFAREEVRQGPPHNVTAPNHAGVLASNVEASALDQLDAAFFISSMQPP